MGWSISYDSDWERDIGYGVPAICDYPGCNQAIARGLSAVCGSDAYGGEFGCGLYFCYKHLMIAGDKRDNVSLCKRCYHGKKPYTPKPDTVEWIRHKLTDDSWVKWRSTNTDLVLTMQALISK